MKRKNFQREKRKTVCLTNPLNSEIWYCKDYDDTKVIDDDVYIKVFKLENENRTFYMRKDALRISRSDSNVL